MEEIVKIQQIITQIKELIEYISKKKEKTLMYVYTTGLGDEKVKIQFDNKVIPYLNEFKNTKFIIEHYDKEFKNFSYKNTSEETFFSTNLLNDHKFINPYILFNLAGNEIDFKKNLNLFNQESIYLSYPDKLKKEDIESERNYGYFYNLGLKPFELDEKKYIFETYITQLKNNKYSITEDIFTIEQKYMKINKNNTIKYNKIIINQIPSVVIDYKNIINLIKLIKYLPQGYDSDDKLYNKLYSDLNIQMIIKNIANVTIIEYDEINPFKM